MKSISKMYHQNDVHILIWTTPIKQNMNLFSKI